MHTCRRGDLPRYHPTGCHVMPFLGPSDPTRNEDVDGGLMDGQMMVIGWFMVIWLWLDDGETVV